MVLGSLIKASSNIKLLKLWPAPEPPYKGISINILILVMRLLKIRSLCDHVNKVEDYHKISYSIIASVNSIGSKLKGPQLEDFQQ